MSRSRPKQGAILLQVSFLILVLMGLAAVVIDLGIVRATQGFMQAGADAAVLEGMRLRDVVSGNPLQSDLDRRIAAARMAALVYDEDLDLSTGRSEYLLGAGPQFETGVAGVHDPAGGQLLDIGPFLPALQLNNGGNAVYGDLVAGDFVALDPMSPGNPDWHAEVGSYERDDFAVAPVASAPAASGFLVRLRRTNDFLGLDNQPGISSSGPTVPFLFGLGSGVLSTPDATVYDPRRDGITVRATAISEARPAVAAGVSSAIVNGVAPIGTDIFDPLVDRGLAFADDSWQSDFVTGGPLQVVVSSDGEIAGVAGGPTPAARGMAQRTATLFRVGDLALDVPATGAVALTTLPGDLLGTRYVCLYAAPSGGPAVIVGFAALRIDNATLGMDGSGNPTLTISGEKLPSMVAPQNASATPALATDLSALLPPSPLREPLLAAVLVR